MNKKFLDIFLYFCVASVALIPRLILISGPPATDEGIYAFNALMIHLNPEPGVLIPDFGTLSLYPMLLSWVFGFEINHFVMLRFCDAVFATIAGLILYKVILTVNGNKLHSAIITVVFLFTMSDPAFIQYGFKNAITVASIPLLTAILIGLQPQPMGILKWFGCGVLMAMAVMLREPFVVFALLGTFAVFVRADLRASIAYIAGGIAASFIILLIIIIMRGGFSALIQSYVEVGQFMHEIAYQRSTLLVTSTSIFIKNAFGVLLVAGSVLLVKFLTIAKERQFHSQYWQYIFWLILALAPLIEPMLKNGYPYHYATSLIGLSGIVALGWRDIAQSKAIQKKWVVLMLSIFVFISLMPKLKKLNDHALKYSTGISYLQMFTDWPATTIQQSNYLLIANKIRQQIMQDHTLKDATLSIHGSMLGLISLAGLSPSRPDIAHLSYKFINIGKNKNMLRQQIYECPPHFIVLTNSSPFRDTGTLSDVVRSMPEYALVDVVSKSASRNYGSFDGAIFKWMPSNNKCSKPIAQK
jgi:hypothetical protein